MQLVLSNNRIIAHGENYIAMGGTVINTETGEKHNNATIAECDGCPSDIDKVGYEYHAGVFVPCAPYGMGNNNGYFMEVCEGCATPRNSGIPIKGGIQAENLHPSVTSVLLGGANFSLLWENASPRSEFSRQTITLSNDDYTYLLFEVAGASFYTTGFQPYSSFVTLLPKEGGLLFGAVVDVETDTNTPANYVWRYVSANGTSVTFGYGYEGDGFDSNSYTDYNSRCVPLRIYGVKL